MVRNFTAKTSTRFVLSCRNSSLVLPSSFENLHFFFVYLRVTSQWRMLVPSASVPPSSGTPGIWRRKSGVGAVDAQGNLLVHPMVSLRLFRYQNCSRRPPSLTIARHFTDQSTSFFHFRRTCVCTYFHVRRLGSTSDFSGGHTLRREVRVLGAEAARKVKKSAVHPVLTRPTTKTRATTITSLASCPPRTTVSSRLAAIDRAATKTPTRTFRNFAWRSQRPPPPRLISLRRQTEVPRRARRR